MEEERRESSDLEIEVFGQFLKEIKTEEVAELELHRKTHTQNSEGESAASESFQTYETKNRD